MYEGGINEIDLDEASEDSLDEENKFGFKPPHASIFRMYKNLKTPQKLQICIGFFAALAAGVVYPYISIIMGEILSIFDTTKEVNNLYELM